MVMQRQAVWLEQQQAVMQQMEAACVAAEDAHRQHMEALLCLARRHDHQSGSGV